MKYLLDTNVCIGLLKGKSTKLNQHVQRIEMKDVCIAAITRFELYYGANKSIYKEKTLETLNSFCGSMATIVFDERCGEKAAEIRAQLESAGTPIGPYDLLISATAVVNELILITHNTKEFSRVKGLIYEDWE